MFSFIPRATCRNKRNGPSSWLFMILDVIVSDTILNSKFTHFCSIVCFYSITLAFLSAFRCELIPVFIFLSIQLQLRSVSIILSIHFVISFRFIIPRVCQQSMYDRNQGTVMFHSCWCSRTCWWCTATCWQV